MTYYLIEAKFEGDLSVHLFDGPEELVDWLRNEYEHAIYTGDGRDLTVFKHDEGGKLEKLVVKHLGTSEFDEDDYADAGYEVTTHTDCKIGCSPVATFSVRIDGRA